MRRRRQQKGFALFAVVVMLLLMTAAVAVALDDAVSSLQESNGARAAEMVRSALGAGLEQAILRLQTVDAVELRDVNPVWDMDDPAFNPADVNPFLPTFTYPQPPGSEDYVVNIGAVPVQATRAPAGEDATESFGSVVEVQISVEVNQAVNPNMPPSGQRVTVGVLVPRQRSGSN